MSRSELVDPDKQVTLVYFWTLFLATAALASRQGAFKVNLRQSVVPSPTPLCRLTFENEGSWCPTSVAAVLRTKSLVLYSLYKIHIRLHWHLLLHPWRRTITTRDLYRLNFVEIPMLLLLHYTIQLSHCCCYCCYCDANIVEELPSLERLAHLYLKLLTSSSLVDLEG